MKTEQQVVSVEDEVEAGRMHLAALLAYRPKPVTRQGVAELRDNDAIWLRVYPGGNPYEVDLDTCKTAAQLAFWIFQLSHKNWCTGEVLRDFLKVVEGWCWCQKGMSAKIYFGGTR